MKNSRMLMLILVPLLALTAAASAAPVEPLQSPRLVRAKDYIAEEQWERAIEQLRAAVADSRERHKDEALFWLAHSQHQARELAEGLQTIATLERQYPKSPWVKPARSLRIEIAQKLRRDDVLWMTVQPNAPRASGSGASARTGRSSGQSVGSGGSASTPRVTSTTAPRAGRRSPEPVPAPEAPPALPAPPIIWMPEGWSPDTNLRIQALGSLIQTDAPKVIPILREIALESPDPSEASRALFVLAQSGRPEAHETVLEVARRGSESVQIAAVKELGRFGGPKTSEELLKVYSSGNPRVKYQVVHSLAEREATTALLQIAEREADRRLRETAIVRLGQAGGREQLEQLYTRAVAALKRPIIVGLFNARAENELIAIAERERDEALRAEILTRLRLLGTTRARAYIEKHEKNR